MENSEPTVSSVSNELPFVGSVMLPAKAKYMKVPILSVIAAIGSIVLLSIMVITLVLQKPQQKLATTVTPTPSASIAATNIATSTSTPTPTPFVTGSTTALNSPTPTSTVKPTSKTPTASPTKKPAATQLPAETSKQFDLHETYSNQTIRLYARVPTQCGTPEIKSNIAYPEIIMNCGSAIWKLHWYIGVMPIMDGSVHFGQAVKVASLSPMIPVDNGNFFSHFADVYRVKKNSSDEIWSYSNTTKLVNCGLQEDVIPPCGNYYSTISGIDTFFSVTCTGNDIAYCDTLTKYVSIKKL